MSGCLPSRVRNRRRKFLKSGHSWSRGRREKEEGTELRGRARAVQERGFSEDSALERDSIHEFSGRFGAPWVGL